MANTDAKESGIQAWMTSVRASMDNDPCRQLFEDQVQTHAFVFLDDYLEQILDGPKQGPIIELVKTPGRKKHALRKTRAATAAAAKVKNIISLSLDDESTTKGDVPVNNFHKALLQAKERATQDLSNIQKPQILSPVASSSSNGTAVQPQSRSVKIVDIPEITISAEHEPQPNAPPLRQHSDRQTESLAPFPVGGRGTDLSVIAEGDESPERSNNNMRLLSSLAPHDDEMPLHMDESEGHLSDQGVAAHPTPLDQQSQVDTIVNIRDSGSSVNTFHSIPLDSSSAESRFGNRTQPLPSQPVTSSPASYERNAFTAPLPVVPVSNHAPVPNAILIPLNDSSPRPPAAKSNATGFPTLPAPSPLRKSMRLPPEPTNGPVPVPAPVPAPLGKRTSWLMKAREAKALDGASSHANGFGVTTTTTTTAVPRVSTAVKRKSGEMLGILSSGADKTGELRQAKAAKSSEIDTAPQMSKDTGNAAQYDLSSPIGEPVALPPAVPTTVAQQLESYPMEVDDQYIPLNDAEDGFIDLFKRTVEGLGARAGKSLGRSLGGGAAAAALAEARAAAEARVAERNKVQDDFSNSDTIHHQPDRESSVTPRAEASDRPLSLEDLVSDTEKLEEPQELTKAAQEMDHVQTNNADESISTTPPDSPPSQRVPHFVKPSGPVFNKQPPPPVFMPPASKKPPAVSALPKESPFNLPSSKFTLPAAMSLGVPAQLTSPHHVPPHAQGAPQSSVQSSQSSADSVFDQHYDAWVPSTQDTSYTVDSQQRDGRLALVDDDDDSWPLEEKLAAAEPGWRPFDFSNVDKEDTWSSLPSESQGPTRSLTTRRDGDAGPHPRDMDIDVETTDDRREQEQEAVEISDAEPSDMEQSDLDARTSTMSIVEPPANGRSNSQASIASTSSSAQSQAGFFSQATKLVNSMLGGSKKPKPELKSLQLAAAAAKKQQEEAERKNQRLKEMEARRQGAITKKAEEERARVLEEEKKNKEELEKRKREREENTDKRPLKPAAAAKDDMSKKRKVGLEVEKKNEIKKPPSKEKKDIAPTPKLAKSSLATPATKTATAQKGAKANATALLSSAAYNTLQNAPPSTLAKPAIPEAKPFKATVPSSLKGKAKAKHQEEDMGDKLPSTLVQSQMAARAKAQMQAARQHTLEVPSESIELPDINSEYSDSEDEDRVRTFDPPDWAQSPELRQALQMQSTVNPDDIFGAIRPLRMEEMFRTRQSRFRARTSSANWSGSDRLTVEEIREYERRMGFQQTRAS